MFVGNSTVFIQKIGTGPAKMAVLFIILRVPTVASTFFEPLTTGLLLVTLVPTTASGWKPAKPPEA